MDDDDDDSDPLFPDDVDEQSPTPQSRIARTIETPVRLARNLADTTSGSDAEDEQSLLRQIRALNNARFERFMVVLLASIGMTDVDVLNRMRPGELDIRASMEIADVMTVGFTIQALNWHREVHGGDVQLLRGGMRIGDHGLMITTSDYQRSALDEAQHEHAIPITTTNGQQLASIAIERGAAKVVGA